MRGGIAIYWGLLFATEAGGAAAEATDVPPRLVTYETKDFISAAFKVSGTMPAAFMAEVGVFRITVN
jgi:hypothetical protein